MSNNISPLISGQLPEHLREDSPLFVNFLETYYRYASQRGKAVGVLQYRAEDSDLDTTTDIYLEKFYEQNAKYFPKDVAFDRRNLLKLLNQIYEAKGTEKALVLVFRLLFNDAVTVTYPAEQILRASGGIWSQENYVTATTRFGLAPNLLPYALNVSNDFGDYFLAIKKVMKIDEVTTRFYYRSYEKVVFFDNQIVTINDFFGDPVYSGVLVKTTSKLTIKNPGTGWQQGQVILFPGSTAPTIARVTKVDSVGSIGGIEVVDYGYTHEDGQTLIISPYPNRPEDSTVDITTELVGVGIYHYRISISDETDGCVESVVGIGTILDADSYFLNDYAEVGYMGKKVIGVLTQQVMPLAVIKTGLTIQEWLASRAILVFNSDYVVKTKGSFYDDTSKISNQEVKLQDNFYYQPFSYVINTPKDIREYEGILTLTHPAGTKRFSDVTKKLGYTFNFTGSRAISVGSLSEVEFIVITDTNKFNLSKPLFSATNTTLDAITYKLLGKSLVDFITSPTDVITNKDVGKPLVDSIVPPTDFANKDTGKSVADLIDPPTDVIANKDTGKPLVDLTDPATDVIANKDTGKPLVDLTDPATDLIANKNTGKAVVDSIVPPTDVIANKDAGKAVVDLIDPPTDLIANKDVGKPVADLTDPATDVIANKDVGKPVVDSIVPPTDFANKDVGKPLDDLIDPPTDVITNKTADKAVDDLTDPATDVITNKDTGKPLVDLTDPATDVINKDASKPVVDSIVPPTDFANKDVGKPLDDSIVPPTDVITNKTDGKSVAYFVGESQVENIYQAGTTGLLLPDLTVFSNLFQNSNRTLPVTLIEQSVGIASVRLGVVRGPDTLVNGDFSGGSTGWTVVGADATHIVTFSGGTCRYQSDTITPVLLLSQSVSTMIVGESYEITVVISNWVSGSIKSDNFVTANLSLANGAGTFKIIAIASGSGFSIVRGSPNVDLTIDSISVNQVTGNHLLQATPASRPVVSARVNMFVKTEQFNSPNWGMNGVIVVTPNAAMSPTGEMTADILTKNSLTTSNWGDLTGNVPVPVGSNVGKTFVFSIWLASISGSVNATLRISDANYYTITRSVVLTTTPTRYFMISNGNIGVWNSLGSSIGGGLSLAVDSVVSAWGAQLEVGFEPTRYQRINTALDYDKDSFLHYLKYDGVDDGLSTNTFAAGNLSNNMDCFVTMRRDNNTRGILFGSEVAKLFGYFESGSNSLSAQGCGGNVSFFVNGVAVPGGLVTNGAQLNNALPVGAWCVLEMRNLDLSTFTALQFSSYAANFFNGAIADIVLCPAQSDVMRVTIYNQLAFHAGISPITGGTFDSVVGSDTYAITNTKVLNDSVVPPDQLTTALNKLMEDFVVAEHNDASPPVISTYDSEIFFLENYMERAISLTI